MKLKGYFINSIPEDSQWFVFRKGEDWFLFSWGEVLEGMAKAGLAECEAKPCGIILAADRGKAVREALRMALAVQRMEAA